MAGLCIHGGWVPTELVQTSATVEFQTASGGFWTLRLDDGRVFVPMTELPQGLRSTGLRVLVLGKVRSDLAPTLGVVLEVLQIQ